MAPLDPLKLGLAQRQAALAIGDALAIPRERGVDLTELFA
jgi:hypothetical protein